ncbi:IS3 family transposase [Aerococcus urinae]|uniref:IS3 family transposase n=1 Tax=Aerococcus urinae TaxID=1376 RepID=A0A7T2RSD8_9LACT|nr:IS3 family transposase [Aerococcus urinae]QPS02354.1 IS3 family transposase [Aerococcus urinae]
MERSGKRVDVRRTKYQAEFKTIEKLSQEGHKITFLCHSLGVSRSAYYKWLNREPSKTEQRLQWLMTLIQEAYDKYEGIYGYRRITIYLNHFKNARVNHKCVYRLMKLMGLKSVIRRRRYHYKKSKPQHVAENVLNREFDKDYEPMQVLLTDITEFKYGYNYSYKAYLSAILDYGANKIIAFKLSQRNNNQLVKDTIVQVEEELIPTETLLHSDRGFQYTSHFFKRFVDEKQLIQSMSRVGKCIDNGPMENFWGIIKEEMYRLKTYESFEQLEEDIKRYIEFYNTERVTLDMGLKIPA